MSAVAPFTYETLTRIALLPAAVDGSNLIIIKNNATDNTILIPDGAEEINFTTDYTLTAQGKYVSIVGKTGVGWYVIANN